MNNAQHLNETVWCRLGPSHISGIGVIALRDIKKGQKLTSWQLNDVMNGCEVVPIRMTQEEFMEIEWRIRNIILDRMLHRADEDLVFISPNQDQVLRSFMNHADDANSDGVYALRDIEEGEEVTENYRECMKGASPHPFTSARMGYLMK